ncbi:MAG: cobalt-precorrin 5A hydrolase [Filifactoraceae bacterium]
MRVAMLSFSNKGRVLEEKLKLILEEKYGASVIGKDTDKRAWIGEIFSKVEVIVFIGAIGIAVRYIAEHIKSKDVDPAVIVIDELGTFIIPILSGHIGGANEIASNLAEDIKATPVITTATDINKVLAIDTYAVKNNYVISDISKIKYISSAILKGEEVGFYTAIKGHKTPKGLVSKASGAIGVVVSYDEKESPFDISLNLIPKNLVLGIGCRRDTEEEKMRSWIENKLESLNISPRSISLVASIDIKKDESCIIQLARHLDVEYKVFASEELSKVLGSKSESSFVRSITGVDNVCERSAILGSKGSLIVEKIAEHGMTLAIAESGI